MLFRKQNIEDVYPADSQELLTGPICGDRQHVDRVLTARSVSCEIDVVMYVLNLFFLVNYTQNNNFQRLCLIQKVLDCMQGVTQTFLKGVQFIKQQPIPNCS